MDLTYGIYEISVYNITYCKLEKLKKITTLNKLIIIILA